MKPKPQNCHPYTTAWASLKLKVAWWRFLWELVRALRVNHWYKVPDRK